MLSEISKGTKIAIAIFGAIVLGLITPCFLDRTVEPDPFVMTPMQGTPHAGKPYRTFLAIERYNMENSGDTGISNVRIEVTFPNGQMLELPEGGKFWPIANGQAQEINRRFEIPRRWMAVDGFRLKIQMFRKGSEMLPCYFEISQLSEFNRSYVCHTDTGVQAQQNIPTEKMDREGIQIRVFTDLNSPAREIPNDALALK